MSVPLPIAAVNLPEPARRELAGRAIVRVVMAQQQPAAEAEQSAQRPAEAAATLLPLLHQLAGVPARGGGVGHSLHARERARDPLYLRPRVVLRVLEFL